MTRALSQLFFIQSRPYATSLPRLLLSWTLMSNIKKILMMSLDLMPWFKTSIDARVEGLVSDMDYLENWWSNIVQNRYGRKRGLFTPLMTPQGKKNK